MRMIQLTTMIRNSHHAPCARNIDNGFLHIVSRSVNLGVSARESTVTYSDDLKWYGDRA